MYDCQHSNNVFFSAKFGQLKIFCGHAVLLVCFSLSLQVQAQEQAQSQLLQLTQLNRAGRTAEAFAFATQLLPEWEGEPAFDLEYGVAAIDSGFISEGIFALERVTLNQPGNNYARLELARAYFAAQEDDRAKIEFERVLAANPPQEVRDNVRPYLDTISAREGHRRAIWRGSLEMMSGYDSNINASTEDDLSLLFGFPPGSLTTETPKEDGFGSLAGTLSYSKPLNTQSDLTLAGTLSDRANASGDLPQTTAGLSVGYGLRRDASTYRLTLQGNQFRLDDAAYRDMVGLSASWRYALGPRAAITVFGQAAELSYDANPSKDSLLATLGVSIQHQFTSKYRPSLSVGVTTGFEDANNDSAPGALQNTERDTVGMNIGVGFSLTQNLQLSANYRLQRSKYAKELVLPPVLRKDINTTTDVNFIWRAADDWVISLTALATDNVSTAGFTDYQRQQISLSARYLFR